MKNFNMMKKLLALTLGAAMLLAVMTGCGKKDTAQEPADDQQQRNAQGTGLQGGLAAFGDTRRRLYNSWQHRGTGIHPRSRNLYSPCGSVYLC